MFGDGWKTIQDDEKNAARFHIERGIIWIFPIYNIDSLCTEFSSRTPDFNRAIVEWRVDVGGRYAGHFKDLNEAKRSGVVSAEHAMKVMARR